MPVVSGASAPSLLEYAPKSFMHDSRDCHERRNGNRVNNQRYEANTSPGELTFIEETRRLNLWLKNCPQWLNTIVTRALGKVNDITSANADNLSRNKFSSEFLVIKVELKGFITGNLLTKTLQKILYEVE